MCGIVGLFTVERPVTADLVASVLQMLDAQTHRGPNDWGILIPEQAAGAPEIRALLEPRGWEHVRTYPGTSQAPAAILGTRRLSIIDLSAKGRMPMGTPDGRIWVTYNGEIYNFRELRDELGRRGYQFRSGTDTEVLLHAYQEWGSQALERLRGMFAFAVLDARDSNSPKLFLAKDRFGIKPLYWTRGRGVFQCASEVRALMAGGLVPNEPEPRGFHGFLVYGSVPTPWTTVRDVFSLPAAHSLSIDKVSYSYPKPHRYWSLPASGTSGVSPEEATVETRRLLEESVRLHLVSDVPLGVFLSGGMDSSALVALASKHVPSPLTTLCVSFDEEEFSEAEYAAVVARRYGTKHIEVRIRARDFLDDLSRIFAALDQPTADGINSYFVAKAAREAGLTVVLSGVGGDELFWGYPGFKRGPRLARVASFPGVRFASWLLARMARAAGYPRLEKLEFLSEHPVLGPYLTIRGLFPPAHAARLLDSGCLPLWLGDLEGRTLSPARYARLEVAHYLQNQLLRDTDVFGMAHSLEVRVPFLDHKLAEFVVALPEECFAAGGTLKPLLARALAGMYPNEIVGRSKMGFAFPLDGWMREAAGEISRETASDQPIARVPYERLAAEFDARKVHWSRSWTLAVLRGMSRRGALPMWPRAVRSTRFLFLLPQVYGAKGGIPVYGQDLLRAVGEAFPLSELRVVSVNDAGIPNEASSLGRLHFYGVGPRNRRLLKLRLILTAFRVATVYRPDVIICGHINLCPLVWGVRALTRARSILLAYGIEVFDPPRRLRSIARRAGGFIAISRFTASRMRDWGVPPDRLRIIPPSVDGEVFRPVARSAERSRPTILTVARLDRSERYKGVDAVLRALPVVRERSPAVDYIVAGTGDDLPRLRALTKDLGLEAVVQFRGFVPDDQLPGLYSHADLFVMPSVKEGFGIVFLEALACGTPVIGGNRDGTVDALLGGQLGCLVDPSDSAALGEAIALAVGRARPSAVSADASSRRSAVLAHYGFDAFRDNVRTILSDA